MSKVMDIKKERGDIAIVPEIEELARTFNAEMRVTESEPPGEVAFLEWAMAAAVALFLARPFFEEIMKELGKETGKRIANAIKKQFEEAKKKSRNLYSAEELTKLAKAQEANSKSELDQLRRRLGRQYAPLEIRVAITIQGGADERLRFVFLPSLEDNDVDAALARLAQDWEGIIQKTIEQARPYPVAGPASVAVYVTREGKWLGSQELIMMHKRGEKI